MIVVNGTEQTKTDMKQHPYLEMFRKEMDSYCTYKEWAESTSDGYLELAFTEMMEDEFLHARFLHDHLMNNDLYSPSGDDEYERKYWKAHKWYFD